MSKYSKPSILREKSFSFAVDALELAEVLSKSKTPSRVIDQFVRSSTSIGANIREAGNAESPKDFSHKMGIAQKECDETLYWIELLKASNHLPETQYSEFSGKASELLAMIKSSILTVKSRIKIG